ncbi:hypothetical protein, partial [Streptomyces sp. 150FB]|uniref:hypothetical protein n=1 Tax=Streptomyces sp. 150FB TaxID=1576605 RepID=UPI001F431230
MFLLLSLLPYFGETDGIPGEAGPLTWDYRAICTNCVIGHEINTTPGGERPFVLFVVVCGFG